MVYRIQLHVVSSTWVSENPKHMFKLMGKKIITVLCSKFPHLDLCNLIISHIKAHPVLRLYLL